MENNMLRIILFLITNLSVMFIFSIILNLTGIESYSSNLNLMLTTGLIGFLGSFISLFFSKWIALQSVNGRIIKHPINNNELWLLNTVSKQSKLIGISMPEIATYDAIDINAFATGFNKNSSLIAVSTGLFKNMNKNEAEAVIAHEITHISNGDMVTITLLQGVLNTFVIFLSRCIAKITTNFFYINKKETTNNNNNSFIYSILCIIFELIFGLLASIIIMWFSRHREFYADAGSAKIVGKHKMIAALQKLKYSYEPNLPSNMKAFCIHGKHYSILHLFSSHPSLDKRINALYQNIYI